MYIGIVKSGNLQIELVVLRIDFGHGYHFDVAIDVRVTCHNIAYITRFE